MGCFNLTPYSTANGRGTSGLGIVHQVVSLFQISNFQVDSSVLEVFSVWQKILIQWLLIPFCSTIPPFLFLPFLLHKAETIPLLEILVYELTA